MTITRPDITAEVITTDGISTVGISNIYYLVNYQFISDLFDSVNGEEATHTRSTSAIVVYEDGSINSLSANTPAFPGSGLLFEPAATNKFIQNETMPSSDWTYAASIRQGTTTDPLGNANNTMIHRSNATSSARFKNTVSVSLNGNKHFIAGLFRMIGTNKIVGMNAISNLSNTAFAYFDTVGESVGVTGGGGSNPLVGSDHGIIPVTDYNGDTWYLCYYGVTRASTDSTLDVTFYQTNADGSVTCDNGQDMYVYCLNCKEENAFTSLIVSGASPGTRTLNNNTVDSSNYPLNNFTVEIEFKALGETGVNQFLLDTTTGTNGIIIQYASSSNRFEAVKLIGGVSYTAYIAEAAISRDETFTIKGTFDDTNGVSIEVNGVSGTGDSNTDPLTAHDTTGYIGTSEAPGNSAAGQIKNYRIY